MEYLKESINIDKEKNTDTNTENEIDIDINKSTETEEQEVKQDLEQNTTEIKENSPEAIENTPSESVDIKNEDANTTNCLALTIQEDHKLTAIKNVFFRSIRMSWKVVVSTITLALIKLFS